MQSTDMRVIRTLHLHRTLSSKTLNPLIAFSKPGKNPQFPKKLVPYPQFRLFSVNADQSSGASWSNFVNVPPQTSEVEAVYDPVTGRVVTKRESKSQSSKEPIEDIEYPEKEKSYDTRRRRYSEVMETNTGGVNSRVSDSFIRKKGKVRTVFVCEKCGHSGGQWWGTCKQCGEVGTMKRFSVGGGETKSGGVNASGNVTRTWLPSEAGEAGPIKLSDVYGKIDENWRIPLPGQFGAEVERVLGGGLVPGSLTLVGGDPGIGKSTLVLQIAALLADGNDSHAPAGVIYVSGEESVEQIGNRADRLSIGAEELYLYSSTDVEDILQQVQRLSPRAVVIDSIQTVYLTGVTGSAGGPMQVKECTSALLRFAKKTNIPVLLIGHVNKTGDIAGPRVLEHIVDVVLYMEGESGSSHRLLRSVKNRFGSTDELGVFKMSQFGLQVVLNPTEMFLGEQHSDSDYLAGLAVAVIMDGARAFLIEIQALCVAGSTTVRHVNGIQASRADMLISVIMKQAGLKIQENGIYLNVVSGITLSETAGDLAVVAAICSSFLEFPIPNGIAFIAEVDLVGELRMVPQLEKRVNTLAKLGYKKCIVPKFAESTLLDLQLHGIEIIGCRNLKEMIHYVFRMQMNS